MSRDPLKLVKFVCVAKPHAGGRSDAALTVHDGVWAFCPMGADHQGHDWQPCDGLPLTEAMRFMLRNQPPEAVPAASAPAKPAAAAAGRSRARTR